MSKICENCGSSTITLYVSRRLRKQVCEDCEFDEDDNKKTNENKNVRKSDTVRHKGT